YSTLARKVIRPVDRAIETCKSTRLAHLGFDFGNFVVQVSPAKAIRIGKKIAMTQPVGFPCELAGKPFDSFFVPVQRKVAAEVEFAGIPLVELFDDRFGKVAAGKRPNLNEVPSCFFERESEIRFGIN